MRCFTTQLKEEQEKNAKLRAQLSATHSRLISLEKKHEQLTAAQQHQRITLGVEVDALKQQLSKLYSADRRNTEHTSVRTIITVNGPLQE